MKVYGSKVSPFVQRVLMAARIKGHELPLERPPGGDLKSPAFREISPLGRIPVLDDDGWTLAESGAIVGYLDDVLDGPPLLPSDARARARVALIVSLVTCELAGLRPIIAGQVFGAPFAPEVIAAGRAQVATGLAAIDEVRRDGDAFACGDALTAADCALLPLLALLEIADPFAGTLDMLAAHDALAAYRARMEQHPIAGRSPREMREGFPALLAGRAARADGPVEARAAEV